MLRKKLIRRFDSKDELAGVHGPATAAKTDGDDAERATNGERGSRRLGARLVASLELDESSYFGFTENLSEDGIFVATRAPQKVGATVSILIALPDLALVRAQGTVRWTRRPSDAKGVAAGLGIRFESLSALDAVRIHDFLQARQSSLVDDTEGTSGSS
jgi:uncharacterized protein (TIGR02266 family)